MEEARLQNYAALIARKGVNVQPGQEVVIQAELDQPHFVELLVEAGADVNCRDECNEENARRIP